MTTFLLIRHGAHDWLGRTLVGRAPGISINATGREQAIALAERFTGMNQEGSDVSAIYSSPLERCCETAAPMAQAMRLPVIPVAALNEINYGAWTNCALADLAPDLAWHNWNQNRATGRVPEGESMVEVQKRVIDQLTAWANSSPSDKTIAVFSHGDPLKAVIAHIRGLSLQSILDFDFAPGAFAVVTAENGKFELVADPSEILPLSSVF